MVAFTFLAANLMMANTPIHASGRCPAGTSGCTTDNASDVIRDRVKEGAEKTVKNPDGRGRVREVKDTLKDCFQCGSDAFKDGVNKVTK